MKRHKPGTFFRGDLQYIALSEVPKTINRAAREVDEAVANGDLHITRIAGCKAVSVGELFQYVEGKTNGPK